MVGNGLVEHSKACSINVHVREVVFPAPLKHVVDTLDGCRGCKRGVDRGVSQGDWPNKPNGFKKLE
jgi:hypothetical protein